MDFTKAVDAHVNWIIRLQEAIEGGQKLDPAEVGKDTLCDLGKWIYGEGAVHRDKPAYQTLKARHTEFHQSAGEVVRKVNANDLAGAIAMVDRGGDFIRISTDTVNAIMKLKKELGM